jgi:hypothetical protein
MFRSLIATALAAVVCVPFVTAEVPEKEPAKAVDLSGSVADESLAKEAPENGVIVSQKGWEKLVKSWGIKDAPKVDFTKEILVVATTRGSKINLTPKLDGGDLKVLALSTRDLRDGFRYVIKSVSRDGVKTVNGKDLPKE